MDIRWKTLSFLLGGLLFCGAAGWQGLYGPWPQAVLTACLSAGMLAWLVGHPEPVACSYLELTSAALLFAGALASLWRPAAMGMAAYGPLLVAGWLLAWAGGRRLAGDGQALSAWLPVLAAVAAGVAVTGILARSWLPPNHTGRLTSTLGYPNAVGIFSLIGLLAVLPALARRTAWTAPVAFMTVLGVCLSGSRAVWGLSLVSALWLWQVRPQLLQRARWPAAAALACTCWLAPYVATGTLPLVPELNWLAGRALLVEGSSTERLTFLRDALPIVRDYPAGAGYRGWAALHQHYASYAYYSAEVHSSLADMAVSYGWLGALAFAGMLAAAAAPLLARDTDDTALAMRLGTAVLGLHALVDWDLSYGLLAALFWFGLGAARPARAHLQVPAVVWGLLAGSALAGALLLGAGYAAKQAARRALPVGRGYQPALLAALVNPWDDEASGLLAEALIGRNQPELAAVRYARALALNPWEPANIAQRAISSEALGRWTEAIHLWRTLPGVAPWRVDLYEQAWRAEALLVQRLSDTDPAAAQLARQCARSLVAQLDQQKAKEPAHTPRRPLATDTPLVREARSRFAEAGAAAC